MPALQQIEKKKKIIRGGISIKAAARQ